MHSYKYGEFIKDCKQKSQLKRSGSDKSENCVKRQITLERWGQKEQLFVSQQTLDKCVIQFVIEEMQPLSIADKPSFRNLVSLGLPSKISHVCKNIKESY